MAQPTPYNRKANFRDIQSSAPDAHVPGDKLDDEFNALKVTQDQIRDRLREIQRDDGRLANGSVGYDQLSPELELGVQQPTNWLPGIVYPVNSTVLANGGFYRSTTAHTSAATFAEDLASGFWFEIIDFGGEAAAAAASATAAAASATATAADRVQTGQDATATAADRVQTGQDATATAADRVQTGQDADRAEVAAAAAGSSFVFGTKSLAEQFTASTAPSYITTTFFGADSAAGSGATYAKVDAEPTHDGKLFITLTNNTVAWYEMRENEPTLAQFGGNSAHLSTYLLSLPPLVIAALGDSRCAGSNAGVGEAGKADTNPNTYFWDGGNYLFSGGSYQFSAGTNAFVDGDLDNRPFYPNGANFNNNIMRVMADELQKKTGRRVAAFWLGLPGATIFDWRNDSAEWVNFKASLATMFNDPLLAKSDGVYAHNVILGANNGAATQDDFLSRMETLVDYARAVPKMGNALTLWHECAVSITGNTDNMNNVIWNFFDRRLRENVGLVPYEGIETSDGTHETSEDMEALRPRLMAALDSVNVVYPPTSRPLEILNVKTGTGALSPHLIPASFRGMVRHVLSEDGYISIDAANIAPGEIIEIKVSNPGGNPLNLEMLNGSKVEYLNRVGFLTDTATADLLIPNGTYVRFVRLSVSGGAYLAVMNTSSAAEVSFRYVGDGTTETAAINGYVLDRWTVSKAVGMSVDGSGVSSEIRRAGLYLVHGRAKGPNEIVIDRLIGGSTATVETRGDGTMQATSTIYFEKGDKCRTRQVGGSGDVVFSSGYAEFSMTLVGEGV